MKYYYILSLSFFSLVLSSQPTISPDAIVGLGEDEPTMFIPVNAQIFNSGAQGQDQVWDFSSLPMGQDCDYVALNPMDSPYFDSFPDSDVYFVCTFMDSQGFMIEDHTFYTIDGNTLQLAGNVSNSISNPNFDIVYSVFLDPLDWGTFPYSYQDMSNDDFETRITSYIGNQTIVAIQTGTSTHEVDSYGTLTTPAGTFENTVRVMRVELAENSIPGIPFSTPLESYRYTWYAENENGVILNLDSIVIKDFMGNVQTTNYSGSYRIQGPTTTSTIEMLESSVSVYPNPTIEELTVSLSNVTDYEISINKIDGKKLAYTTLQKSENKLRLKIQNTDTFSGMCILTLTHRTNGTSFSKPVIINP